jgi:hypothetical protein
MASAVLRYLVAGPAPTAAGAGASRRVWEMVLILEGTPELPQVLNDGTEDVGRGGDDKSAELWALKGAAGPTVLVDLDGATRSVWLTGYEERVARTRTGRSLRGKVELVEA